MSLFNYSFSISPQAFQTVQKFLKKPPFPMNTQIWEITIWLGWACETISYAIYTCSTTCTAPKLRPLGLKVKPAKHIMAKCVRFVTNTILFKCIFSMRRNRSAYSGTPCMWPRTIQAASLPKYNCISTVPSKEQDSKILPIGKFFKNFHFF